MVSPRIKAKSLITLELPPDGIISAPFQRMVGRRELKKEVQPNNQKGAVNAFFGTKEGALLFKTAQTNVQFPN